MKKISKIMIGFLAILTGLLVSGVVSFADIYEVVVIGVGGISMAAISGGVTTGDMNTDGKSGSGADRILTSALEKNILLLKPDDNPLDTLIRSEIKKPTRKQAWKVEWPFMETRPFKDQITTGNATANAASVELVVANVGMWLVDDTIMVHGIDGKNSQTFVGKVTVVVAATDTITVFALNGVDGTGSTGNQVPVIADDTYCTRLGNSKEESAADTAVWNGNPELDYNYQQIHMTMIEETVLFGTHKKDIDYDFALQKALNLYDLRSRMEATSLIGQRAKIANPTSGKLEYYSHGILNYIDQTLTYGTSGSPKEFFDDDWIDITKTLFSGNNGSEVRYMFVGKDLMAAISKLDTFQKQIDAGKGVEVIHGVRFNKVETNFGTIYIKRHKMLDEMGWDEKGFVVDIKNINRYVWEPLSAKKMDFESSGIRRVKAVRFMEIFCLGLKYPDTHAIIAPFS